MAAPVPLAVVAPPKPDEEMIMMLECFMERARNGEMDFLACICTFKDTGAVSDGYVKRSTAHNYTIVGVLECAKAKYLENNTD